MMLLPAKRAVSLESLAEEKPGNEDATNCPTQADQQPGHQLRAGNLVQKYHGWEVRQVLERQRFQERTPASRQQIKREHLAGNEERHCGDDVEYRRNLQHPEADAADADFEEEADDEAQDEREQISHQLPAPRGRIKVAPCQTEDDGIRRYSCDDVRNLVCDPVGQQPADHIQRLYQILLDVPLPNVARNA